MTDTLKSCACEIEQIEFACRYELLMILTVAEKRERGLSIKCAMFTIDQNSARKSLKCLSVIMHGFRNNSLIWLITGWELCFDIKKTLDYGYNCDQTIICLLIPT